MKLIYTTLMMFCCMRLNAQTNINLIITIDNEVVIGSISGMKLMAIEEDGRKEVMKADYYPGNLSISEEDYQRLNNPHIKTVYLVFNYTESQAGNVKIYSYDIDMKKAWLKNYFHIVHIYNTSKKRFKRLFNPPPGKDYVYEFDYPGGSTRLVRKQK